MKTLHTIYSTFAKNNMAKFLTVLTMLLIVGVGQAWGAETYSYTFTAKQFSANSSKTLNSVSWTLAGDGGYWGYDGTKGQQFGSSSAPYKTLTLSTSGISGTIKQIKINTSGASSVNASFTVSVGGTQYGSSTKLTTTATEYTFTGSKSGEIKFSYTQTSSKALYIKSISVTYETAAATVPVTGVSLNKSTLTLTEGDSETLTATITPANATDKTVTWTTNKSSVATVSNGTVTAIAEGSATITVKTTDGNKTATCSVTVKPKPKYTVTLVPGSGSVTDTELEEPNAGEGVTLPTPTLSSACQLEGWSFAGWAEASVGTEITTKPTLIAAGTYKPASNITLYAVYKRTEEGEGGDSTPTEVSQTYTFSEYEVGTQYAEETYELDDDVTINIKGCHINTQLRVYGGQDGTVISEELPGRIVSMGFNMGYKADALVVYGSTNGSSWTEVGKISTITNYKDYTLDFGETNYTYFKLDVAGTSQIRVASMSITWESTSAGGTTTTTYYHSTPDCGTPTPTPTLNVDPATLTFENTTTNTSTEKTFTLTGSNLTANASLQLSGINPEMFSLSSNSVIQSAGSINQTITITYTPTAKGNHSATLTISSTGADDVTISLSGTGTAQTANYTVKHYQQNIADDNYTLKDSETLSAEVGTQVTPTVKSYTGFTAPSAKTVTIASDGSTVVEYQYTRKSFELTWNVNGGDALTGSYSSGTLKYGAAITKPTDPTRDGHSFKGWHNGTSVVTPATTMPANNLTYTAQWAAVHKITWMVGSTTVVTETVTGGVTQTPANDPEDGAIGGCANKFMGWSETPLGSAEGQSAPSDLCTAAQMKDKYTSVTGDKTFYAVFATAGAPQTESVTVTQSSFANTSGNLNSDTNISYKSYKGEGTTNPAISSNAIRLYQNNNGKTGGYIIIKAATGCTITSASITSASTYATTTGYLLSAPASTPSKSDFVVSNYSLAKSSTYTVSGINTSAITFACFGTTSSTRLDIAKISVTYTKQGAPSYSNYVTNCCELLPVTNLQVSGVTENSATLTWTKPSSTTDITELQIRNADNDAVVVDDINPTTTTATIDGLYECTKYNYYVVSVGAECEVSSETITAQPFSGSKTVTFNYNGNGQANTTSSTSCGNTSITLPTPTWAGYRIMGWFNAASGGTKIGEAGASYTPTADITLFAHWEKEYTVTYSANGGSTSCTSGNYIAGETVTICTTNPTKTGHTFAGWTYSPEVTITDGKFTMPASDVTITAQWTINSYTVTWKPNGGNWAGSIENIVHTYDYGATINRPADPTRDGYRFTGWNATVASTMPATNITYTAQWKQNYTITFYDGNDVTPWTQTKDAESIDLDNYVGTHACGEYNFAGWSTASTQYNDQTANITTWVTGTYTPAASINLYAVYVKGDLATNFTLNCDGGVYEIWEKGHNQHMAGRQNGGGDKFYTTEYWDANNSESNGAPFTITKVADNTYTLQNADGQYITRDSYYEDELEIEETRENADRYKWTISNGTNGTWRFTNKAATSYALVYYNNKYFELHSASSVTAGNTTTYDLELTPAQTNVYQSNPNCGPYTITFETHGGEFVQRNYKYSTAVTANLTDPTICQFPSAELDGYTFAGWKDGADQDDVNYEPYLKKQDDILVVSSNKTYHAVYYYYDEEEDIDWSKEFTTSIYADVNGTKYFLAGTPSSGTMSSTTDCGYVSEVTITPGTGANAEKYKITVDGVGMAPEAGETDLVAGTAWWTITETSAGSGEYKISGQDKRNIVLRNSSFGHYSYNAGSSYGAGYYYPRFGKCLEHHWTSNPPIKLTVTYNPNGATSGTAPVDNNYYQIGGKVYVLGSNDLQKENYAFGGWNTQADGLGDNYEEGEDFNITENTTLYAKWDCATYVNITKGTPVNGTFNLSVTGTQYTCENGFVVSVTDIVPATGYRFDHITQEGVDAANVEINNDDKTVTYKQLSNGSSTINVVFAAIPYTVTWDPNGGNWGGSTDSKVDTYNYGASITKPAEPTRTGYTFAGWSPTPASSMPAEDVTYTAQWTANTNTAYKVEHYQEALDGSYTLVETDDLTGTTDAEVTPARKTYEGFTSPDPQTVKIAADGSLVVKYQYTRISYQLTWELNGGDITAAGTAAGNVLYGTELKAPQLSKVDNVFMGWEPEVPATMPASDATYIAQWIELTNFRTLCEYTVTWKLNGGNVGENTDDIVHTYTNGQVIQKPTDPTRDGHHFLGWDPEFVEGTTMQGNSLEYTAQWKALIPTSLHWSEDAYTAALEADNDFPDLTISPNDFAGTLTYQSSNPAVATIASDGTITLKGTGTTTITASIAADDTYLAASDSYELTVAAANCKWVETTTIEDGDEVVITMTNALGTSYALPNQIKTSEVPTTEIITNTTSFADRLIWIVDKEDDNFIFESYNNRGNFLTCNNADAGVRVNTGTNKIFIIDDTYGYLKNIAYNRYLGVHSEKIAWYSYALTNTGNFPQKIAGQTLKFYKKVCLDPTHYWVTWDAGDGQFADGSTQIVKDYAVGHRINEPFAPTRAGYEFAGWSTDGVNVVTPAENMPNENLTYIAVWKIKSYTVTWDANGGQFANSETIIEQTYEYGATITKPADPTRTGYTFTGWAPNVPTNMSTENLTFKAQWQVNQYTVTWNPNGGNWHGQTANKVDTYDYGATIVLPEEDPVRGGWVFNGWEPTPAIIMPANNLTYTAQWGKAYCDDKYTFHTGTNDVWNNPIMQNCFEHKTGTEWQIENYVIPAGNDHTHFLVAYSGWPQRDQGSLGGHSKSVTSTWSETMYLAPAMDFSSAENSPKVGHAAGAKGTLRIFDDSSWDNLCVGFIPDGYMLKFGADEYKFMHYENTEYRSEIVEYNSTTANNNVSVGIISNSDNYVKTDHTQEGMRHIFVRDNIGWMGSGAKVAIYYWSGGNNGWSGFLTKVPGETNLYVGLIPVDYTSIKLIRYKDTYAGTPGSWNRDDMWNETGDLTISTTQQLLTFSDWNSNPTTSTYKHKGKFRIYNDSRDKNWYVHFYPHYVITFDKNALDATGTMQPQALPLDTNPKTMVLNECAFERRGYDFTGWKTDVAITADGNSVAANGKVKDKATITNIDKDITLTAQWEAQSYKIIYKDQGGVTYSGENSASLPQKHTYDQTTTLVAGAKTGYTFGGWYLTPECDGTAITELGAKDYTADITLYAKWTFAMEYNITNTETIFITSAEGQTIKATQPLKLKVSNMPIGTTINLSAGEHIHFYYANEEIKQLTNKHVDETFELEIAYKPVASNTKEKPSITLEVLGHEKVLTDRISCRSLPNTFAIVAKVGSMWYALPSQGLSSSNDLMGYPVEVDNQDDPTLVAYVPENADWSLRQVYKSTGTDDRFGANGDNILFVNGEDKALNASRTEGYVLTDAQYALYQTTTNPDLYEWTPATTDLETYQLTNAYRPDRNLSIDILTRFGIYKGEIENLRFLPIQGRYTQATFQVVEWKENSVVIMYNGTPDQQATLAINGVNVGSAQLSAAKKDFAVYELPANGLVNQPTKRLLITIGSEQKWLTIPYIISGEKTDAEVVAATSAEIATATDVFILKGAKFTATATSKNSQYRFRNVTVYGGGKLVIGSGKFLSMNSIILRAGGITAAGEYDYVYPQFDLQGTLTNSAGEFKYDYITDYEHWYHLVLPFDGKIESPSIKYPVEFYGNNVSATNSGSWVVKRYDGATRATGNYDAWVDIESENADVITAGHGYIYWGAPKKVKVNGEEKRQKWGIQRIVMKKSWEDARDAEIGNKTISGLGSYANVDNNSDNVYDQGWNLIGNPYMVNLTGLNSSSLKAGQLIEELDANGNWTGGWVLDSIDAQLRYITIPSDHFEWYTAEKVSKNMTLVSGRAFFVQIAGGATDIMFEASNRARLMPALRAAHNDEPVDIETGIVLSSETMQDEVNFWISDGLTNDYEYNADYPKTLNTTNFNIYGVHTNGDLSWVATGPEFAKESMPIGYQVPAAGTYMLSISEDYYSEDLDALYITDHEKSPELTVDLMSNPYEFSVNQAETNNTRFTVALRLKLDDDGTITGLENIGADNDSLMKFIYQDKMYILHHGVIYDATGKRVTTINK